MTRTSHDIRITNMSFGAKINSFLGLLAGQLLSVFGKSPARPTTDDLSRMEFKTSTQRLGIRFSERIREVFRFKWLRVSNKMNARRYRHSERSEVENPQRRESHHFD